MKSVLKVSVLKVFVLLAVFGMVSCSSKSKVTKKRVINSIDFVSNSDYSLTEVIEMAEAQNKLVFMDFHADWCLPCKLLDEEVFNQREVYSYFNRNFINYKVDVEKGNGANLKLMYGANELPTLLFINQKTYLIDFFLFTVMDFNISKPKLMEVKYQNIDGLLLPVFRRYSSAVSWEDPTSSDSKWVEEMCSNVQFDDFNPETLSKITKN